MKNIQKAFTIVEILIAILIVSIVLITGFQTYGQVLAGKVKLIEQTKLQKETVFFTEKLFQTIKQGGTIDYEEYFNRKVVGTTTSSGHYDKKSGFGNFGKDGILGENIPSEDYGEGFYYCRSGNGSGSQNGVRISMTSTGGCYDSSTLMANLSGTTITPGANDFQRYGQYSFQFWDYNSDRDDDEGDLDDDKNIIGDDDDENLGNGPRVFTRNIDVKELYLISGNKKTRTFFRYNVKKDKNAPSTSSCNIATATGSGCLGTIEFLRLEGKDNGMDHEEKTSDNTENDGVIDTWIVDKRFSGKVDEVAGTNSTDSYWKPLFPESIHVSDFKVFPYPNMEEKRAWNLEPEEAKTVKFSPYVILSIEIQPSWVIKRKINGKTKPIRFNKTINLTDIFSK